MTHSRTSLVAVPLPNGKVLIAGGKNSNEGTLTSTEFYNPATNSILAGPAMNDGRWDATGTLLPNDKVLIASGFKDSNGITSSEVYDPDLNSFSTGPTVSLAHGGAGAALLPTGKVII